MNDFNRCAHKFEGMEILDYIIVTPHNMEELIHFGSLLGFALGTYEQDLKINTGVCLITLFKGNAPIIVALYKNGRLEFAKKKGHTDVGEEMEKKLQDIF